MLFEVDEEENQVTPKSDQIPSSAATIAETSGSASGHQGWGEVVGSLRTEQA